MLLKLHVDGAAVNLGAQLHHRVEVVQASDRIFTNIIIDVAQWVVDEEELGCWARISQFKHEVRCSLDLILKTDSTCDCEIVSPWAKSLHVDACKGVCSSVLPFDVLFIPSTSVAVQITLDVSIWALNTRTIVIKGADRRPTLERIHNKFYNRAGVVVGRRALLLSRDDAIGVRARVNYGNLAELDTRCRGRILLKLRE